MNSHARLVKLGLNRLPAPATALLQAYLSVPSAASLTRVFDDVPSGARDPFLWSAAIAALARSPAAAAPLDALCLFCRAPLDVLHGNPFAFASAARAAASLADPFLARALHAAAVVRGLHAHVVVATAVLDAYSKCDDLESSRKLFGAMPERNAVTWNVMIAGCANVGASVAALELFRRVRCTQLGVDADEFAVASCLTACTGLSDLRAGTQVHAFAVASGFEGDGAVRSALANMYFRCGEVESAERTMERREETATSKLMLIKGYIFNEKFLNAIEVAVRHRGGFTELASADRSVVASVLAACARLRLLRLGRQVHGLMTTMAVGASCISSTGDSAVFWSALMDMYFKCACINEARSVFDSLQTKHASHWNSAIAGYSHAGLLEEARNYFDAMPHKDVVSWTAMISGYVNHGSPREGLCLLAKMHAVGGTIRANCFTFATALDACSRLAAKESSKQIHAQVIRTTAEDVASDHLIVATALVGMYSRSGNLDYARRVFDGMTVGNVVSWTAMITGYAAHGLGREAIEALEQMMTTGVDPNGVTFVAVLSACSHSGLVAEGLHYFKLMTEKYCIRPTADHHTCIADMLGRAGKLAESREFAGAIESGDAEHDASTWGALLAGCSLHGDVELGSKLAGRMIERGQQASEAYVALSNMYALSGMWHEVHGVRERWRRRRDADKEPGQSLFLKHE